MNPFGKKNEFYSLLLHLVPILSQGTFRVFGFHWIPYHQGDLKLGFWVKTFRQKKIKKRLVVIPGFGDAAVSWYRVLFFLQPFLKKKFDEVLLIDFPGFGGKLAQENMVSSLNLMQRIVDDALDLWKPHTILAHSLGGWLAGHYAADCGAKKRPLLKKSSNFLGPQCLWLVSPSGLFVNLETRQIGEALFKASVYPNSSGGFSILRPFLFEHEPIWFSLLTPYLNYFFERQDVHQFIHSFLPDHELKDGIQNIDCSVKLIWGEKDKIIPISCMDAWVHYFSVSKKSSEIESIIISEVGHSPHIEQPFTLAKILMHCMGYRFPYGMQGGWNVKNLKSRESKQALRQSVEH